MIFKILDYDSPTIVADKLVVGAEAAVNMLDPIHEIVFDALRVTKANFSGEGRRGGGSWAQLSDETYKKRGTRHPILRTSNTQEGYSKIGGNDELYRSVTVKGAPYQILHIENDGFELGTDRPFAYVHQYGSPNRKIPARPFLRFTPVDERRWKTIITRHLMRVFYNT